MRTRLSGSLLLVTTLGLGVGLLASTALAETPSKPGKAAPAKSEGAKGKATPAKDDKKPAEASPESKPEAKPEVAPAPPPNAEAAGAAEDNSERKISPFESSPPSPQSPGSEEESYPPPGYPPPGYGYPPPAYGDSEAGYPPPGYGYPPPAYDYPPPGFGHPHCRFCARRACERSPESSPEQRPGHHAHDGFFLRLGMGGGYARTSISIDGDKLTYSGTSVPFELAMGAAIRPNLVLFGEVFSAQMFSPTSKYAGETRTASSMNMSIQGVGPGVAYYFMPINIYISGSVLLHKVSFTSDNDDYESTDLSTIGFAANLMAGKEWWVSRDWGIGLAAHLMLGTAKNRALYDESASLADRPNAGFVEGRWNSVAAGLLMSATYN